jgi:hypothetical protein
MSPVVPGSNLDSYSHFNEFSPALISHNKVQNQKYQLTSLVVPGWQKVENETFLLEFKGKFHDLERSLFII